MANLDISTLVKTFSGSSSSNLSNMINTGIKTSHSFMGFSIYALVFTFAFSILGLSYFRAGKKEPDIIKLLSGIGLLVFPLFVKNPLAIIIIGLFFAVIPWLSRRFF